MISSGVILTKLLGNIRIYSGNPYQRSSIQGWNHFIITPHISWLCFSFLFYRYIYIKYKFEVVCGSQIFIAESSPFSGPLKRGRLHELQKRYEEPPPLLNDKSSIYRRFHSYSKCVCVCISGYEPI